MRIIDQLRRAHPEATWKYEYQGGSRWVASDGRAVVARSTCSFTPGGCEMYGVTYQWEPSGEPANVGGLGWLR